jgi:hypothetical protein
MRIRHRLSGYFPDRPPTWTDIILIGLITMSVAANALPASTIAWSAVAAGFLVLTSVVILTAFLPLDIGGLFDKIGGLGRLFAVFLIVIVVLSLHFVIAPSVPIYDAVLGVLFAAVLYLVVYVAGTISGWE